MAIPTPIKTPNELLMMFIADSYEPTISRETAIAAMRFVEHYPELQSRVNNGDIEQIHKFKLPVSNTE